MLVCHSFSYSEFDLYPKVHYLRMFSFVWAVLKSFRYYILISTTDIISCRRPASRLSPRPVSGERGGGNMAGSGDMELLQAGAADNVTISVSGRMVRPPDNFHRAVSRDFTTVYPSRDDHHAEAPCCRYQRAGASSHFCNRTSQLLLLSYSLVANTM